MSTVLIGLATMTSQGPAWSADDLDVARADPSTLMRFVRDARRVLAGKPVYP